MWNREFEFSKGVSIDKVKMMKVKQLNVCLLFAAIAQQTLFSAVYANPAGASIVNGQVSFSQPNAATLQITNSAGAIINWQDFNIGAQEITRFVQDNNASAVLNRVVSGNASQILGKLQSNGQVYLINPNGLVIGRDAVIDTAGFIGSTLNISDQDFLNGRMHFQGDGAADIENKGYIYAGSNGDILLIAPNITNSGVLEVDGGNILLAAGQSITIASLGDANISFEVQAAADSVSNLGQIIANNGAANMFAGTLTHSGSVSANGITTDAAGNIRLVAKHTNWIEGDISATGNQGGDIRLLGAQVGLDANAVIDASGTNGGGQILIGGDYQGQGNVRTARASFVGEDVQIKADALDNGDGGKVIVWSDESTRMYGRISATGGALSGDGGFVETSGGFLDVGNYAPDVGSSNGMAGTWLLDPNNITIASAADSNISAATPFTSLADTAVLSISTLLGGLSNGNVVIQTSTAGTNSQAGNITWNSGVTLDIAGLGTKTLTLNAHNDINFLGNLDFVVTPSGNESITLNINPDFDGSGAGGFTQGSASTINLAGFSSGVGVLNVTGPGDFVIDGNISTGSLAGSQVNLTTTGGSISQLLATSTITTNSLTTSSLSGDTTLSGANIVGNFAASAGSGSTISFDNRAPLMLAGINAVGADVFIDTTSNIAQSAAVSAANLDIKADGNILLIHPNNDVDSITIFDKLSGSGTLSVYFADMDDLEVRDATVESLNGTGSRAFFDIITGGNMTLNGNIAMNREASGISGVGLIALNGSNIIHQSGTITSDRISFQNDGNLAATGAVGSTTNPIRTAALASSVSINLGMLPESPPISGGDLFLQNIAGDLSLNDYLPPNPSALQIENIAGSIDLQSLTMVDSSYNSTDLLSATSISLKASGSLLLTPLSFPGGSRLVSTVGDIILEGFDLTIDGGISAANNVELQADAFNITAAVTAANQVVVRELNATGGLEVNDGTPTAGFATLTTTELGFLTGSGLGILLGNNLAHNGSKTIQLASNIDSSMINGPALTFDTTNNGNGASQALVAANIDFTTGNENLLFTGNGTARIEPTPLPVKSNILVDTGTGNFTSSVTQLTILGSASSHVNVRTNNADITGDLFVGSGVQAGSLASLAGNNLTVQGGLSIIGDADSAEVNFANAVAISSASLVDVSGGSGTDAFASLVGADISITSDSISLTNGAGANALAEIRSTTGNVELHADTFNIGGTVTAQNQIDIRELNNFGGLEINDGTPTTGFATLTTTELGLLTGTTAGIVLGNNLASSTPRIVQLKSAINSSMINGSTLTFDTTNNNGFFGTVVVAADIDFTTENENLDFTGSGSAFIEPAGPSGILVDTGLGNLTSSLSQFTIHSLNDGQVIVKTNNADFTGNLSVRSGNLAGSSTSLEGNNLTVQGSFAVLANADSAEVNFTNAVAINSASFVDVSAGLGTDAFARLIGGDINITSTSVNLLGGEGANALAEISSAGTAVIDTSGVISLQSGTGADADSIITTSGGLGSVTLQYATCTSCNNQLSSDPAGNGISETGIFARTLSLNGSVVVDTGTDTGSESSHPNPTPALDSLLANFQAGYVLPVVESSDTDEEKLSVCR